MPKTWKAIISKNLAKYTDLFYKKAIGLWGVKSEIKAKPKTNIKKSLGRTSDGITKKQYDELAKKIEILLKNEAKKFKNDKDLIKFLDSNKTKNHSQIQSSVEERIYYLLINRLKNWTNREQIKKDGGVSWKRKFKKKSKR